MPSHLPERIGIIDSHTAGEPTRLVIEGGPSLGVGPMADRLAVMRRDFDIYRTAILNEPRGSDVIVGALLCGPSDPQNTAGVIFFNNAGYLGMCGHGAIGVIATLAWMGRIGPGEHHLETPVGVVQAVLHDDNSVTIENVPAHRKAARVTLDLPGYGLVTGDVAWGGNWFFLVEQHGLELELANVTALTTFAARLSGALEEAGITGDANAKIDHIEFFAPGTPGKSDSRNFVLCPGNAYDRSPCGTGTSAKMAALVAQGKLGAGETWRQEGILGTVFEGSVRMAGGKIIPSITGSAYVTAEATLIFDPRDPFRAGIAG